MSAAMPLPACLHLRAYQMSADDVAICMSCGDVVWTPEPCKYCGLPCVEGSDECEGCKARP